MKPITKPAAACLLAAVLAACGGGDQGGAPAAAPNVQLARVASNAPAAVAADYNDLVQRVYVSYFGRPADVAGLAFYAQNYLNAGAPTTVAGLPGAYASNAGVKALIDSFATSAESQALYPGDNTAFINAVYRNLFNRDADAAGSAFWAGAINAGSITRASAAVAIMAGAQTTDLDLVNKKNVVASAFTASLDTDTKRAAYDGLAANVVVRAMLAGVGPATVAGAAFQPTIDGTIAQLVSAKSPQVTFAQIAPIIKSRCVGCHSAHTTIPGFSPAQAGISFDTEAQIRANAGLIYDNSVASEYMPYGNITNMTEAERALIGAWFNAGRP